MGRDISSGFGKAEDAMGNCESEELIQATLTDIVNDESTSTMEIPLRDVFGGQFSGQGEEVPLLAEISEIKNELRDIFGRLENLESKLERVEDSIVREFKTEEMERLQG